MTWTHLALVWLILTGCEGAHKIVLPEQTIENTLTNDVTVQYRKLCKQPCADEFKTLTIAGGAKNKVNFDPYFSEVTFHNSDNPIANVELEFNSLSEGIVCWSPETALKGSGERKYVIRNLTECPTTEKHVYPRA